MVGEEDPAGSRGPCPLPSGRKTFWRSASWSSRSPSSEKDCCDTTESNAGQIRRFPVPLTPRSQHNSKARACLPPLQPLSIARRNLDEWPKAGSDDVGEWPHPPTPSGNSNKGLKLDLSSFQQNLDPSGTLVKKDRIACFDKECSKVAEHIYLGGDAVARDREILKQHGITHVLNCVGFVCPEYFKADLVYKTLWLQDSPSEDITSILYDVFDYFEDVREQGGRVLVHCCQGVSRSTSLVIAYLMWREGQSFEDAFQYVKAARGIANPNMGFACQLLQCQKRVHAIPLSPSSVLRMYRMAPHSPYDPLHLVPKMLNDPSPSALDSRGAFIIHVPSAIYVWVGKNCESVMERDAKAAAFQVVRYERVQGPIITVEEGEEPMDFWDTFSSIPISVDSSDNSVLVKEQISSTVSVGVGRKKVDLYDADFEFFHKALTGGIVPPFSSSTGTEHETRVPARESNWSILRRKFVSGSVKDWISASRAALCRVYSDSLLMVDTNTLVNKIPLFPPTLYSNSSVNSKSSLESPSPSPSTEPPSLTPSTVSSTPTDSLSKFPHPAPVNQEPPDGELSSQPCSKSGPSLSKGRTLSLAERRGNLSPSLKLSTFKGATSSAPSPLDSQESNTASFEINERGLSYPRKQNLKAESASIKTGEVKGKYWVQEGQELSMLDGLIDSGLEASKSMHPLIYSWPGLEKIVKFGGGDLDSKAVFLFLVPGTDVSRHKGGKLYLWIGSCFEHQNRLNQINENKESIEDKSIDWNCVGSDFLSLMGLPKDIPIKVVKEEENKPEEFLELLISF